MTSKDTFLQNNEDTKFLLAVVSNPAFDRACVYAKQSFFEQKDALKMNPIETVNAFLEVLRDLPVDDTPEIEIRGPGLHRDVDIPQNRLQHKRKKHLPIHKDTK